MSATAAELAGHHPAGEILARLERLYPKLIDLSLDRITRLLAALGHPERRLPPVIHVAGTNGKGSTSSMLASILKEAGYRVGLYTSPHIIRFNERIRVDGRSITDKELVKTTALVKRSFDSLPEGIKDVTFFEFTTAVAFQYFKDKKVDIAVVETGMGGRFDATNALQPLASVITNIALDHMEWLGDTVEDIAREKAGIIKKGAVTVTGEGKAKAFAVLKKLSKLKGSRLLRLGRDFSIKPVRQGPFSQAFDYSGVEPLKWLKIRLLGDHQLKNAACALASVEALKMNGLLIGKSAVRKGLWQATWPARFETVSRSPLVILDCAHNPDGASALKEALFQTNFKKLILVLGVMADKDIKGIMKGLVPSADAVIVTAPATPRAATVESLAGQARAFGKDAIISSSVKDGIKTALSIAGKKDAVVVTGSIFTIAEAKRYFEKAHPARRGL